MLDIIKFFHAERKYIFQPASNIFRTRKQGLTYMTVPIIAPMPWLWSQEIHPARYSYQFSMSLTTHRQKHLIHLQLETRNILPSQVSKMT